MTRPNHCAVPGCHTRTERLHTLCVTHELDGIPAPAPRTVGRPSNGHAVLRPTEQPASRHSHEVVVLKASEAIALRDALLSLGLDPVLTTAADTDLGRAWRVLCHQITWITRGGRAA